MYIFNFNSGTEELMGPALTREYLIYETWDLKHMNCLAGSRLETRTRIRSSVFSEVCHTISKNKKMKTEYLDSFKNTKCYVYLFIFLTVCFIGSEDYFLKVFIYFLK